MVWMSAWGQSTTHRVRICLNSAYFNRGSGTRAALEEAFRAADLPLIVSMQVGNNSAIKQGVAAGLGIALISRVAIDMELETKRLVMLDVEGFPIMRQWHLIHLKDKNLSATALAFKYFVLQQIDYPTVVR